jgi:general secretion pathway protein B
LVFVVLGILIGSVSSYTILAISNNSNLSLAKWLDTSIGSTPDSAKSPSDVQSNLNEVTSQGTSTVDNNVDVKSQKQNDKSETIDPINQATQERAEDSAENIVSNEPTGVMQVKTSTTQKKEEPPVQRQLVNGVLLEEGQKLLGYQGTEDDVDESPKSEIPKTISNKQSNNSDSNTDKPLNSALYRRIQQVAKDVDDQPSLPNPQLVKVTDLNDLPRIDQLSAALLTQMPSMSFSAHMYASNPQDRWVRVNSKRVGEGDIIANNVMLKRIESEKVVLEYKGTEFTMNALSDW